MFVSRQLLAIMKLAYNISKKSVVVKRLCIFSEILILTHPAFSISTMEKGPLSRGEFQTNAASSHELINSPLERGGPKGRGVSVLVLFYL